MNKKEKTIAKDKLEYKIPKEGSLGLLAAGDKGIRAWRKVRDVNKDKQKK